MKPYTYTIKKGHKGDDVKEIQERLIDLGFTDCLVDGKHKILKSDGDFGVITETCLANFQAKVIDASAEVYISQEIQDKYDIEMGEVDFPTWYILKNYEALSEWYGKEVEPEKIEIPKETFAKTIIEIAKSQLGVREEGGNNRGRKVNEYIKIGSCGEYSTGLPWCQYFMNWVLKGACEKLKLEYKGLCSGYTPSWVNWGKKRGLATIKPKLNEIIPGSFGYIYGRNRGNAIHVFLITGTTKKGNVVTIEGNTNDSGGREGYKVAQRYRPLRQVWCQLDIGSLYK